MNRVWVLIFLCLAPCGCTQTPPESSAQQADDEACRLQADSLYNSLSQDQLARPTQTGLLSGSTPDHVFDAEKLGALNARQLDIKRCELQGNTSIPGSAGGKGYATPHIVGTP